MVSSYRNTERSVRALLAQREAAERELRRKEELATEAKDRVHEAALSELGHARLERAAVLIQELVGESPRFKHTYRLVERRACKLFKMSSTKILSRRRKAEIVFARQFIMYWTIRLTALSYPQIGRLMDGRDHTTILSGTRAYRRKRAITGRALKEAR